MLTVQFSMAIGVQIWMAVDTSGYSMHFTGGLPDNCAPIYVAKAKSLTRRRGSPAKAKTENLEL